jgi:PAS domain S-box-containing protein
MSEADREAVRVLLVDDEPQFADLAAKRLEEEGPIRVSTATDPLEGLDVVSNRQIDCIVSDYGMPEMDGLEFLERVREQDPDRPFILLTARGSEEVASKAITAGVTDYFRKGLDRDQYALLANRIENAVERVRAKTEVSRSQQRFQALVANSTDIIQVVDEDGEIRYQSPSVDRILGHDQEELVGESFLEMVHPDDRAAVERTLAAMAEADEETTIRGEVRIRHADGSWRWLESVGSAREGSVVEGFVFNSRDVTERRERERELEESQRRFDAVFDDPESYVAMIDPTGGLERANSPARELVGAEPGEYAGDPLWETPWWADTEVSTGDIRQWVKRSKAGEYVSFEVDGFAGTVPVAGTIRPVTDEAGRVESILVEGRDVTERRRREWMLSDLHDVSDQLMSAESREEVIEIVNRAAEDVFEFPLAGVRLLDGEVLRVAAVTEETQAALDGDIPPPYEVGDGFFGEAFERKAPAVADDLRDYEFSFDYDPVKSAMAIPLGEYGLLSIGSTEPDVFSESDRELATMLATQATTALARAEREQDLRRRESDLKRQNQRLEEFASFVSHDLRNPLEASYGYLELAQTECDSEYLDGLGEMLERMENLVEDVLALARHGQTVVDPESVELDEAVADAWATAGDDDASLEADDELGTIRGDRTKLGQLLSNLFANAVEHGSPDGDPVTVEVGHFENGFYVADDGPGIPGDERETVFDPGKTGDEDGGTGLGLAIVNQIADAHGWTVSIAESDEGGARFEIREVER